MLFIELSKYFERFVLAGYSVTYTKALEWLCDWPFGTEALLHIHSK
jgi:hypothetical protein